MKTSPRRCANASLRFGRDSHGLQQTQHKQPDCSRRRRRRTHGGADVLSTIIARNRHNLLVSERTGGTTWGYGQALRALRELVSGTGRNPEEYALHPLRIGETTDLAAGGSVSERVIKREGRWKSDAYRIYTRNNLQDSDNVSRRLASSGREREHKTTRPVKGPG